jgi:hypothetical protein
MKHEKNGKLEVYYERLLKLTNSLQHMTTNNFLIIICRFGLQPCMRVTIGMKRETLQQHMETTLVFEKGIF